MDPELAEPPPPSDADAAVAYARETTDAAHRERMARIRLRVTFWIAVSIVGVAFLIANANGLLGYQALSRQLDRQDEISDCTARYATAVSSAQVDNDLAFNALVILFAQPPGAARTAAQVPALKRIAETGRRLDLVRAQRLAWQANPVIPCPIPPPALHPKT